MTVAFWWRRLAATVATCLFLATPAQADSWVAAKATARASANGQFVVRIAPGSSMGEVYGFGELPKGPHATAQWHRFNGNSYKRIRTITLLNPIAPVDIEVTDRGALVTIDNWHNRGGGNVLVIYSPLGEVVKKFTLRDLYSEDDIARFETSVSSVYWRCPGLSSSLESSDVLWVDDNLGGRFVFKLDTGAFVYQHGKGSCQ